MRRIAILLLAFTLLHTSGCATVSEILANTVVGALGEYNTDYPKSERSSRTVSDVDRWRDQSFK
jgi:hypothetical protein